LRVRGVGQARKTRRLPGVDIKATSRCRRSTKRLRG